LYTYARKGGADLLRRHVPSTFIIVAIGVAFAPVDLHAQITVNPTKIEFTSPDHNTKLASGAATISKYVLEVWARGADPATATPATTSSLGKPAALPGTNDIVVTGSTALLSLPAGYDFFATVKAIGPEGEARSPASNLFTRSTGPLPPEAPVVSGPAGEIVLYAADVPAANRHGRWALLASSGAAGGVRLENADQGNAKLTTASASPANYVDIPFTAVKGVPYHVWLRMRAAGNAVSNDSLFVQFTSSLTAGGAAAYRIGTTSAAGIVLEEGHGAGLDGWGWNDMSYGGLAEPIYFATDGAQVIRIQQREDGIAFDQVVISAGKYGSVSPGALKRDTVVVPKP